MKAKKKMTGEPIELGCSSSLELNTVDSSQEFEMGFLHELSKSKDPFDLKKRILKLVRRLGFSDYGFIHIENSSETGGLLLTNPSAQLKSYYDGGFHEHDLMMSYVNSNTSPIFLSQVYDFVTDAEYDVELFARNREIYRLNQSYGYFDYYTIPMLSCNDNGKVLFTITQKNLNSIEFQTKITPFKSTLRLLAEVIDHICATKFHDFFVGQEIPLTNIRSRPLQVLDTLANKDISIKQVADELNISVYTVNQHLAAARKAFAAKTTIGAIRNAVLAGLIDYKK